MPSSNLVCWPAIIHLAWETKPATVLDVGPGRGKGGLLFREYIGFNLHIDAVEMEPSYITPILLAIYNDIFPTSALNLYPVHLAKYDLVLMVDVIEHMTKEQGMEFISRCPGWMVICTPETFFQNPRHLPSSEKHRSLWTVEDFESTGRVDYKEIIVGGIIVRLRPLE